MAQELKEAPKVHAALTVNSYLEDAYGAYAKCKAASFTDQRWLFVIGNEASDLDSVASSIALAYCLHHETQNNSPRQRIAPLMNIRREELALRPDAVYALGLAHVDTGNLLFLDDVDLVQLQLHQVLSLWLVDHNKLSLAQTRFADAVIGITDHHVDEHQYEAGTAEHRTIERVGSACTLVTLRLPSHLLDADLAILLLAAILLDTSNMSPVVQKGTAMDAKAIELLQSYVSVSPSRLFDTLQQRRSDYSHLSMRQLLSKDSKLSGAGNLRFCISSVPVALETLLSLQSDAVAGLRSFSQDCGVSLLVVMSAFVDGDQVFRRQTLVYSGQASLLQKTSQILEGSSFGLQPLELSSLAADRCCKCFSQRDVTASRKQIMPLLTEHLAKL